MPSVNYLDWVAQYGPSRIVLCEPQPGEILGGFALISEFDSAAWDDGTLWDDGSAHWDSPRTYSINFPRLVQSSVVAGGVYRRLDAVYENDSALTQRSSIAAVNTNLGSWYYDSATETLYVSTTTGSDPDSFAVILALFSIFLATEATDFVGGELYEPRLVGALPSVRGEAADPLFGVTVYPSGMIAASNRDRFFDTLQADWVWKNKRMRVYFGGGTLARSDYEQITTMLIEDMAANDELCTWRLRHVSGLLDMFLPLNTYPGPWDRTKLGDGTEGTYRPLLYGAKTDIPPVLVDKTAGAQIYEIADPTVQVLMSISAVRAINRSTGVVTTLTETTHYTKDLTNCRITVTSGTYDAGSYQIRVDATGESDGAGGYLSTCGEIWKDILLALGETAANLDLPTFDTADADAPAPLGLWIREGKPASEYIRLIETSVFGSLLLKRDGRWSAFIWSPSASSVATLEDADFAEWEPDAKIESLFWLTRVKYDQNPATGSWKEKTASDSAVKYAYEIKESVPLDTILISDGDATILAQRYQFVAGAPSLEIHIKERGLTSMTRELFDRIAVTRARGPVSGGVLDARAMDILGFEKTLSPAGVRLTLSDLWGIGSLVGTWAPVSAPDWSAASATEKDAYGFWSDNNGLIDPADSSTRNQSLWW